jgi:hypothetical protein
MLLSIKKRRRIENKKQILLLFQRTRIIYFLFIYPPVAAGTQQ